MTQDLQGLLEKINREGVEKAQAEAAKIVADAKAEAAKIVADAKTEAEKAKADAEKAAADYEARARVTLSQAARDVVAGIGNDVKALFEKALAANVDKALADGKLAVELAGEAVKGLAGDVEIVAGAKLVEALRAGFAAKGNVRIVTDEARDVGFSVKIDNGRVEHAFTSEMIAAELARRLRPDLAKLVK